VPDHLGEGQECLGDGDVSPDRLGELVPGPRLLGDQGVELLGATLIHREALVDQRDVVGDRLAVAGEDDLRRQLARPLHRLEVGDERLGAPGRAVERPRDQRVRGDVLDQVVGGQQDPPVRVPEDGVGGAVSGAVLDLELSLTQLEQLPVVERPRHRRLAAPGPEAAGHLAQCGDHLLRDAVAAHEGCRLLVVALGVVAEVLDERHQEVEGGDLGAGALGDDVDQPEMIDVLVGDDHELEIVDPVPERFQLPLELVERLPRVGAGVQQRQRLALQQIGVDSPDPEWGRDPQHPDAGVRDPLPDLDRRLLELFRHERISPSTSSRFSSMCSWETSDSRLRRSSGSVFDGRTLKCQSG
jgi:hypothetical protein